LHPDLPRRCLRLQASIQPRADSLASRARRRKRWRFDQLPRWRGLVEPSRTGVERATGPDAQQAAEWTPAGIEYA
jgi:hypothetical protein